MACGPKAEHRPSDSWHFQEFVLTEFDYVAKKKKKVLVWKQTSGQGRGFKHKSSPQPAAPNWNLQVGLICHVLLCYWPKWWRTPEAVPKPYFVDHYFYCWSASSAGLKEPYLFTQTHWAIITQHRQTRKTQKPPSTKQTPLVWLPIWWLYDLLCFDLYNS